MFGFRKNAAVNSILLTVTYDKAVKELQEYQNTLETNIYEFLRRFR